MHGLAPFTVRANGRCTLRNRCLWPVTMQTDISSGTTSIGTLTLLSLAGAPAIGGFHLEFKFSITWRLPSTWHASHDTLTLADPRTRLSLLASGSELFVGEPQRVTFEPIDIGIQGGVAMPRELKLGLFLTPHQLDALETRRNGSGFDLKIQLWSSFVFSPKSPNQYRPQYPAHSEFKSYHVEQSQWLRVLNEMGHSSTVVFELPMPSASNAQLLVSVRTHLESAQKLLTEGNFRESVGKCRDALEVLRDLAGDPKSSKFPVPQSGDLMEGNKTKTKEERAMLLRAAALTFAHPAHHPGATSSAPMPPHTYTRADAVAMVTIVSALCRQFSQ